MKVSHSKLLAMSAFFGTTGNSAVHVAIPWLVLETTGSSAQAGIVLGLSGLSVIFTAPLIGGLIAILGARPVSVWADIISGISVLLFPIIGTLFGLNIASLLVIAIFGAMFDPAGGTARKSLIQPVVEKEGLSLTKFNGTYEAVATIGTVIGPTAAALAISIIGVNATFYVIAVVFVFASATASLIPVITVRGEKSTVFSFSNVVGETRLGVSTLWRDKPLLSLVGLYTMLIANYMPVESIELWLYFKALD